MKMPGPIHGSQDQSIPPESSSAMDVQDLAGLRSTPPESSSAKDVQDLAGKDHEVSIVGFLGPEEDDKDRLKELNHALSKTLSETQKCLAEATQRQRSSSHEIMMLVSQLQESMRALQEAQDLARQDMLREAEHNQLMREHAIALSAEHTTMHAQIEELSLQLAAAKCTNKQANVLFDNLLLDHEDLVVQHHRVMVETREGGSNSNDGDMLTLGVDKIAACQAGENNALLCREGITETECPLKPVQTEPVALESATHDDGAACLAKRGAGVAKRGAAAERDAERARIHAKQALLSLDVALQSDGRGQRMSVGALALEGKWKTDSALLGDTDSMVEGRPASGGSSYSTCAPHTRQNAIMPVPMHAFTSARTLHTHSRPLSRSIMPELCPRYTRAHW